MVWCGRLRSHTINFAPNQGSEGERIVEKATVCPYGKKRRLVDESGVVLGVGDVRDVGFDNRKKIDSTVKVGDVLGGDSGFRRAFSDGNCRSRMIYVVIAHTSPVVLFGAGCDHLFVLVDLGFPVIFLVIPLDICRVAITIAIASSRLCRSIAQASRCCR
jgi:hypothetical protein